MKTSVGALGVGVCLAFFSIDAYAADSNVGAEKAAAKSMEKQADADHKAAKKACESLKGDAEKACRRGGAYLATNNFGFGSDCRS